MMSLMLLFVLFMLGTSSVIIMQNSTRKFSGFLSEMKAQVLAEAGIERAVVNHLRKDQNKNWTDNQNRKIYTNEPLGGGNYSVQTRQGNSNFINLLATGRYRSAEKQILVTFIVNWETSPPIIYVSDWKEGKYD